MQKNLMLTVISFTVRKAKFSAESYPSEEIQSEEGPKDFFSSFAI